jgi:putative RecB family exonuclease
MIGVMDLVEQDSGGTIVITEYKTTSKAYSTEQVERMFQLTIYNMAAKRNGFGNCEIVLKVDSLIKTQNPRLELFYTTRSDGDEKRAIKKIQEVWRGIQNKIFIPNEESRFCSKCEYRGYCDNWAN